MSGHSKWATIKRAKGEKDLKRGKIFNKVSREIMTAIRLGGENPETNLRLKKAIKLAKSVSMPKDKIQKLLTKKDITKYEEITYEGFAPGGVAFLLECLTDNKVRTVAEVRHIFEKAGGNLGETGSVKYLFHKVGHIIVNDVSDKFKEIAIELGANDLAESEDATIVMVDVNACEEITKKISDLGFEVISSDAIFLPKIQHKISEEVREKASKLVDEFDKLDDVQAVYTS